LIIDGQPLVSLLSSQSFGFEQHRMQARLTSGSGENEGEMEVDGQYKETLTTLLLLTPNKKEDSPTIST